MNRTLHNPAAEKSMKTWRRATLSLSFAMGVALLPVVSAAASAVSTSVNLPGCQHFYTGPIPNRPPSGGIGPGMEIPAVSVSGRLPAPGGVTGGFDANGTVTFTFARVAGAQAYRAFRNGQALQWI